jgi:Tfp pilus assembly protein PilF
VPAEPAPLLATRRPAPDSQALQQRHVRRRAQGSRPAKPAAQLQVDRGDRALRKGDTDRALAAFKNALSQQPDLPSALRGIAMVHLSQGHERDAKHEYMRYLQLSPDAPDAARIRKVVANLGDEQ